MNQTQTVLIGLDVSSYQQENLESIRRMDFLRNADIHLVHVVREFLTGYDVLFNSQIVIEEDKELIKLSVISRLKEIGQQVLPFNHSGKVFYHCLFGFDPKRTLVNVAADLGVQLMVLAHRKEQPLFDDSMSHYCSLNAHCDVLIIRDDLHEKFKGKMNVACAIKLDDDTLKNMSLKKYSFLNNSRIDVIHVCPTSHYSFFPGLVNKLPPEDRQIVVREAILNRLKELQGKILPDNFTGEFSAECLFSNQKKKAFCEKANEIDADLMIIPQKQKTFGSFIHFQLNHANKNLLILRIPA